MHDIHTHRVLILDFGSQYTQLIARRVREIGVYSEILPWDIGMHRIRDFKARAVILSGGPESVHADDAPKIEDALFELGVPILGICYGMQAMAWQLGGNVEIADHHEYGFAHVAAKPEATLLGGLDDENGLDVWMSHGDRIESVPAGFSVDASTQSAPIAAMSNPDRNLYGLQFHPEVTHTQHGEDIIRRFLVEICGCETLWTAQKIIDDSIERVKQQVGDQQVLLGLSGGVDSSVVATLLHEAIGDRLTCVFVDTGLLRLHEGDQVMDTFAEHMGIKVIRVDAGERFLSKLAGHDDPEAKRKIIGNEFIAIFEEEAAKLNNIAFLAQGTIYPDVIESAGAETGKAHVIKSHHNVGGLPEYMKMELVEPLRELFKDEVRKIGVKLGLPEEMVYRHPFPGPGLGVRILGEVRPEYVPLLQQADDIFMGELVKQGLYHKVSQAFAVFLPVKSVGVTGDQRRYGHVVALRAVETIDFMTARWAHLPYDFLDLVSRRIINEIPGISRVAYDISGKPPATIEWE